MPVRVVPCIPVYSCRGIGRQSTVIGGKGLGAHTAHNGPWFEVCHKGVGIVGKEVEYPGIEVVVGDVRGWWSAGHSGRVATADSNECCWWESSIVDGNRQAGGRDLRGCLSGSKTKGGVVLGQNHQARTVRGGKGLEGIVELLQEVGGLRAERAVQALGRFMLTEATGEAQPGGGV